MDIVIEGHYTCNMQLYSQSVFCTGYEVLARTRCAGVYIHILAAT